MQTFLPVPSYLDSAALLDYRRLGKQRLECKQLLAALLGQTSGWRNHPAAKMWAGHEDSLCEYALAICDEWIGRGYKDSLRPHFSALLRTLPHRPPPRWLGDPAFHAAHRSNLLRKDTPFYDRYGWKEPIDLPYVWPQP